MMNSIVKSAALILLGGVLGYFVGLSHHPIGRFAWSTDGSVLDTKTGQVCIPMKTSSPAITCLDLYKQY